jgi:hypothetical protein
MLHEQRFRFWLPPHVDPNCPLERGPNAAAATSARATASLRRCGERSRSLRRAGHAPTMGAHAHVPPY